MGACVLPWFCTNELTRSFELEKTERPLSRPWFHRGVQSIVLTFFDIFLHLRGLKLVDKMKKYRRDNPLGIVTDLGCGLSPHPSGLVIIPTHGE